MRVLLDHPSPFLLAHGELQIRIEQTVTALKQAGLEVDYLRWWDDRQSADVIHYFGRPPMTYLTCAQRKGIKVVLGQSLNEPGSRRAWLLPIRRTAIRAGKAALPWMIKARFAWDAFRLADACVANTPWDGHLMQYVFGAAAERIHVIPDGVEEAFLNSPAAERGRWLVCPAAITERECVLELAEAAARAETPLWFIGKPYEDNGPYLERFLCLTRQHSQFVRYEGAILDRDVLARVYREARGVVLLSGMQTRRMAADEAAACRCPLLLSDLHWARSVFGDDAWYCPAGASLDARSKLLREFYGSAPGIKPPPLPPAWPEVAQKLAAMYEALLG